MSDATDFLSLVAAGEARPDQIDDYIDQWHDGASTQELHEFLGLTMKQYAAWLREPDALMQFYRLRQQRSHRGNWHQAQAVLGPQKSRYRAVRREQASRPGLHRPFARDARAMHHRRGCENRF